MAIISLIAAMAKNRVIGANNQMPWHLPADLKHFKSITTGKPVIMGRKTFDSIGRALPNRRNIVISHQTNLVCEGAEVMHSVDDALTACTTAPEIMIIGGANLYTQALEQADRLYLTFIDLEVEGDAHFPAWDESCWHVIDESTHEADNNNPHGYRFLTFEKNNMVTNIPSSRT